MRQGREGGWIIAAGGKTDGAASLRKRIAGLGADVSHTAKNHGLVFWMRVGKDREKLAAQLGSGAEMVAEGGFKTAPGMFSHGRIDPGSKLLAEHIPCGSAVRIADFCAGWGYLSAKVVERCPDVTELHLYEADFASIEAAKHNVVAASPCEVSFFWHDLAREPVHNRYDLIVMNPPFHHGRKAEPEIGRDLIGVAASALVPRGRLLIVANRNLPYEQALASRFSRVEQLIAQDGYKVLSAIR